jgi:HAD superfamily hydrolase (TIGR01509 family)
MISVVVFDWGGTVMRDFGTSGPMASWPEVAAVEGVADALERIANSHRLALATNAADSDEALVRQALARAELDRFFPSIFVSSEIGAEKPAPAFFRAVISGLGCAPDELVMVGDSYENDVRGGRAAGMWTIWFNPAARPPPGGARDHDALVNAMNSLPFVLHRLEMWVERAGRHMLEP